MVDNIFALEHKLIEPEQWDDLYNQMPDYCQKVVDDLKIEPHCIGIGWDDTVGWFVLGAGQGPHLIWKEK